MYLHPMVFFTIPGAAIATQLLQDPIDTTDTSATADPWRDSLLQNGASGRPPFDGLAAASSPVEETYLPPSSSSSNMIVSSEPISQSDQLITSESRDGDSSVVDFQTADTKIPGGCSTPNPPGRKLRAREPQSGGLCPNPQPQSLGKPLQEKIPSQAKPVQGIPLQGTTLEWAPFKATPLGWEVAWPIPGTENSQNPIFYPEQQDQSSVSTKLSRIQCGKGKKTYCCGGPEEPHPRGTLNVNDCVRCMCLF